MLIAAFSFVYGNPVRIINGYDSFGNTCGTKYNRKMTNDQFSGLDTSDKPFLLFYDIKELRRSLKTCVKECPTRTLKTVEEIPIYYKDTKNNICIYGFNYSNFTYTSTIDKKMLSGPFGPCPVVPIYER